MSHSRTAQKRSWITLAYKMPPEPASRRVAVWRKLKSMGAVYLQSGVCVLPGTREHQRRCRLIEREIEEMDGEAILLKTESMDARTTEKVVARFAVERDEAYGEFISRCDDFEAEIARERKADKFIYAEVEENEVDLVKLRTWLERIQRLDFFGAPRRCEANERLARCAMILDQYARDVFERQAEADLDIPGHGAAGSGKTRDR